MNHLSLAARYRPQTFAEVAGQPLAALALSRAASQDRVAPAYLLSGTRGVGKTTIARIFAKALNCEHAPAAEPCNQCAQCRHITAGNHVDVNEIDGASNTGVDDVRALRETIGFMPMEGRYKIFIVDEAHMLSKSAFNALLKTLEEPPPRTVFIFATTEAHRFPATIISRCQHFVFRHLPENAIFEHLSHILTKENIKYEDEALHLLARRAAGSVRDSLSLLDQAISVIDGQLDAATVRQALGVAGPELFAGLLSAISHADCSEVVRLAEGLLAAGVDMAYFTRELAACLRNLFLLRQAGEKILPSLNLTADEQQFLKSHAPAFTPAHLHAAWQMALQSQRSIAQSPSPGSALELLLINLAILPQLLPVGSPDLPQPKASMTSSLEAQESVAPYQSSQASPTNATTRDWAGFRKFCKEQTDMQNLPDDILARLTCQWTEDNVIIRAASQALWIRLGKYKKEIEAALARYCGAMPNIKYLEPQKPKSPQEVKAMCEQKPEVKMCREILGGTITKCSEKITGGVYNAEYE